MKRVPLTDFLLWAILAISFGATRLFVQQWNVSRQNHNPLVHKFLDWADRDFVDFDFTLLHLGFDTLAVLVPFVIIAWIVQAVIVACGLRLIGRRRPAQADDHEEKNDHGAGLLAENRAAEPLYGLDHLNKNNES